MGVLGDLWLHRPLSPYWTLLIVINPRLCRGYVTNTGAASTIGVTSLADGSGAKGAYQLVDLNSFTDVVNSPRGCERHSH
jgi:hypothetical protein